MARAAQTDAQNAYSQYSSAAQKSIDNANSQTRSASDRISTLEQNNPYTSKSYLQNQNLMTSAAMNATNTAGKQQLRDTALRTGTNTASLGRTIASNARAGQRTMEAYNAGSAERATDKATMLQQGLIADRMGLANTQAGLYGTSTSGEGTAENNLTELNGQNQKMWGDIIAGAAGAAGSAFGGKA